MGVGAPVNREEEVGVLNGRVAGEVGENIATMLIFLLIGENIKGVISQENAIGARNSRYSRQEVWTPCHCPH